MQIQRSSLPSLLCHRQIHAWTLVYVDDLPLVATASDGLVIKIATRTMDPYHILSATRKTENIDEEGIPKIISFDCESLAQNLEA